MLGVEKNLTYQLQSRYRDYLQSAAFENSFYESTGRPTWRRPLRSFLIKRTMSLFRTSYSRVLLDGQPVLGAVLMANEIALSQKKMAPALVIGTFDFSQSGLTNLLLDLNLFHKYQEVGGDSEQTRYVEQIYDDQEFVMQRKRRVPEHLALRGDYVIYDSMLNHQDMLEDREDESPIPLVMMLAIPGLEQHCVSAILPREVATPGFQFLHEQQQEKKLSGR